MFIQGFFILDSWFFSKRLSDAMNAIGANFISIMKSGTKGFCQETVKTPKKD